MEGAEETLTYRDVTGLLRKLLPVNKEKDPDSKVHATEIISDESNYVDLNMKPDGTKTVKVSFTGEGNQLSVVKCDSSKQREHEKEENIISGYFVEEQSEDTRATVPRPLMDEYLLETPIKLPDTDQKCENETMHRADKETGDGSELECSGSDELRYTDMYLNSRSESDDCASAVLSDHCSSDTVEDESHYITTHEIQLTELDHDVDYDLGRGTCWDFEDNNLVYSFVDYASFESDDTQEGTLIVEGRSRTKAQSDPGGGAASTEQEEEDSDLCDSDKCPSSDESVCKNQSEDTNTGELCVSVETLSRTVNEPVFANETGDRGHFSVVRLGVTAAPLCDRAKYFIPAPGRQHLASKIRRKDINEYSSGNSSSISELDDADKEVRNLTAKSFRSLACPYFDAINLSTSSESSMSEYGLNKWSSYMDRNYGNMPRGRERGVIAQKTSLATLEMNRTVDSKIHGKSITSMKAPQTKMYPLKKRSTSQQSSSSSKTIELKDSVPPRQRGVMLNVRCNVEKPECAMRPKCSKKARSPQKGSETTGTVMARSGCEMQYHHTENTGGTPKRAGIASNLLQNVISKKMQFEQDRKFERGEVSDRHPVHSQSFPFNDQDGMRDRSQGRGFQRQSSESGSGVTINSGDDQHLERSRPSSCEPAEEYKSSKAPDDSNESPIRHQTAKTSSIKKSNSLKEDEPTSVKEAEPIAVKENEGLDRSSMLTKLLFVPRFQHLSKDKDISGDSLHCASSTNTPGGPHKCEREVRTGNYGNIPSRRGGKTPEIKICLRSVKENKGCALNIANLLTPKINFNTVNTYRAAADAKYHIFSACDRIPNFTVRDIRDTKCKLQTPIYHVRDVRKLVKSSYRFVSLDNSESKCSTAAEKQEENLAKRPVRHLSPSPMVIKCNSVKTNTNQQTTEVSGIPTVTSQKENILSQCITSRVPNVPSKQLHPDHSEIQPNFENKLTKQRQEKFAGEIAERRNEPRIPKQAALEKIKAAVKTMEQLYVYDRNEWKRKTRAQHQITDSHVLPFINNEEQGAEELDTTRPDMISQRIDEGKPQESKGALNTMHVPYSSDTFKTQSQKSETFNSKGILQFGNKAHVSISSVGNHSPQNSVLQTSSTLKSSNTLVAPLSVKIETLKNSQVDQGKVKIIPTNPTVAQDSENYLTIPGLGYTNEVKLMSRDTVSREASSNVGHIKTVEQQRSPLVMEYPPSTVYLSSGVAAGPQAQQPVLYFSPSVSTLSPTPSPGQTATPTQRKMLLDPTTGLYYLVDTSTQAIAKRLFDPETGQYVDVPMPHSPVAPVAPVTPVTPVPLSLPPLALSPGAYAPTYMICPGFIPSPTLQAQAIMPQPPCHSEGDGGEKVKNARSPRAQTNTTGGEVAYYSATGEATHGPLQLPVKLGHVRAACTDRKPVISITTQQGPRIVAPPSFDGTTMSFVVEHR